MLSVKSTRQNVLEGLKLFKGGWFNNDGGWTDNERIDTYDVIEYEGQDIICSKDSGTGSIYIHALDSNKVGINRFTFQYGTYGQAQIVIKSSDLPSSTRFIRVTVWVNHLNPRVLYSGKKYPAQAVVQRNRSVNGERTMSLSFLMTEMNADFLSDLGTRWQAVFDKETYTMINPKTEAVVKGKSIAAIQQFFIDMGGMYLQDEVDDKSMTALNAYIELFENTGYTVHLVDNFYANTLNYQKNQSKLERFHYYNERFKAEFLVSENNVYLYNKIGSYKPDVRIDEDLNVKSASVDIDDENFFNWCHCYYDIEQNSEGAEGENYRQHKVWQDPDLIAKYGEIEGPAIYQGNIRHENAMMEYARDQQDQTIKISYTVDIVDLKNQGYGEFEFSEGDTVRLSLSSINTTRDIRVVDIDETFVENEDGTWSRIVLKLTLGNASVVQSYKRSQNSTLMDVEDWLNGRREMPPSIMPAAIKRAADIVIGDTDSVMEYRKDRLVGHHSKDEGNSVELNVSGIVLNRGGIPKAALTFEGMTADVINTGQLNTNNVKIVGTEGIMTIDGDEFFSRDYNDASKFTRIGPGSATFSKNITVIRPDGIPWVADGVPRFGNAIITKPWMSGSIDFVKPGYYETTQRSHMNFERAYGDHSGRYANFLIGIGLNADKSVSNSTQMRVRIVPQTIPAGADIQTVEIIETVYAGQAIRYLVVSVPTPAPTFDAVSFLLQVSRIGDNIVDTIQVVTARCWTSA